LRIISSPIRDREGRITAIIEITEDITVKRKLEKEILNISERERHHIGQDLHDDLGQHLIGTEFRALTIRNKVEENQPVDVSDVNRVVELVRQAIQKTRKLARGLCPVELDFNDLSSALEKLTYDVKAVYNINCVLEYDDNVQIEDHIVSANLYHITQEAINNAIKHGDADNIKVRLAREKGYFVLDISDNGKGLPKNLDNSNGLGLSIMRYRANIIDGKLDISSNENGTVVSCIFEYKKGPANGENSKGFNC